MKTFLALLAIAGLIGCAEPRPACFDHQSRALDWETGCVVRYSNSDCQAVYAAGENLNPENGVCFPSIDEENY